jgi:molybdenum cofactor cytidylyltransferase
MPETVSLNSAAVIVLAAGASTRMGVPKQLIGLNGRPLLRHAVDIALAAACGPVVVVIGYREQDMRAILTGLPLDIVINDRWAEGMGASIQMGLRAVASRKVEGAILMLADQPLITPEFLRRLVIGNRVTGKRIVAARYAGTAGVPAFFSRDAFPLLSALPANQGCKSVIFANREHTLFEDCPEAAIDIDTPEDYCKLAPRDFCRSSTAPTTRLK